MPTAEVCSAMDAAAAMSGYHWPFLAGSEPLPERLIKADPVFYLETTLASWTKAVDLSCFAPDVLEDYRTAFRAPGAVHAICEDLTCRRDPRSRA